MLSQLTIIAVSIVEKNTHKMIRVDTLFEGARRRIGCGFGSTVDLGGIIGPRNDGFPFRIDHKWPTLELRC